MLYLVDCELNGGYPMAAEEWLVGVVKSMEMFQEYKKKGKVVFQGGLVGRQAGCSVWDVASNNELQGLLTQLPVWPFMEWTVTPMISTDETLASAKQALASVRAAG